MSPRKAKAPARRFRGEGTVTQRADGRWQAALTLPKDPGNPEKRNRVFKTHKTEQGARDLLAEMRAEYLTEGAILTKTPTVEEFLWYYMNTIETKNRPRTRAMYHATIRNYIVPAIGKIQLAKLTPEDVLSMHQYALQRKQQDATGKWVLKPVSSTTARHAHAILARALTFAVRFKHARENVARLVDAPQINAQEPDALSLEETIQVMRYARYTPEWARLSSRWAFALLTGARQGECLGLKWEDVDFLNNVIRITRQVQRLPYVHGCGLVPGTRVHTCGLTATKCPERAFGIAPNWNGKQLFGALWEGPLKTAGGYREVPLTEPLRTLMVERYEASQKEPNPHGLVWTSEPKKLIGGDKRSITRATADGSLDGQPIDPALDSGRWTKLLAAAGVRHVRLHDARHTAVTMFYNNPNVREVDIQNIVGHTTVAMTRKYRLRKSEQSRSAMELVSTQFTTLLAVKQPETPAIEAQAS